MAPPNWDGQGSESRRRTSEARAEAGRGEPRPHRTASRRRRRRRPADSLAQNKAQFRPNCVQRKTLLSRCRRLSGAAGIFVDTMRGRIDREVYGGSNGSLRHRAWAHELAKLLLSIMGPKVLSAYSYFLKNLLRPFTWASQGSPVSSSFFSRKLRK